jgi:RNA polymerase sigma factor (sigma-70 family)
MTPPPAEQFAARIFVGPALRAQPDRRLVDLVRDGYDAAFEEIVRRYRRPLDRFAAAIVGGRSEDVTQDAFSKALLALRGSEAEIELRPWLYRIVRNTALNDLRDRAPVAAELSESLPGARSAAAEVEAREELRELMERLQALPETQRAALVMRELEGLSHEEIAAALGVSGGAARQAIFRARAALREGFGLLLPLPLLRALADHSGEAGAAGGAVALGGGALKAGMATVLIAGAVGASVAVEHHHGHDAGPEAAEAAPLAASRHPGARSGPTSAASSSSAPNNPERGQHESAGGDKGSGNGGRDYGVGSLGDGDRSGSGSSSPSGGGSRTDDSNHSGSGSSGSSGSGSTPGTRTTGISGSGDRHGGSSGSDDGGESHSGSGSDDSGGGTSGDDGGSSGGSGSDDGFTGGDGGGSSGPGGGEIESDPIVVSEPTPSDDGSGIEGSSGSSGGGSGSGDSGSTSGGDLSGGNSTSGSDGSP